HLDIDPAEINKNVKTDVEVWGDCKETLPALSVFVNNNTHSEWVAQFQELYKTEYQQVIEADLYGNSEEISMGEVLDKINSITKGEAILVTDVGQHQMVTCRYGKFNTSRQNITSGGLGTMGFGLPAAIGAWYGNPNKPVIAIVGDGGIQ